MTKLDTAKCPAQAHRNWEPNLTHAFLVEPIKLIQVIDGTMKHVIEPVAFARDGTHNRPYVCLVIEVSPREFAAPQAG